MDQDYGDLQIQKHWMGHDSDPFKRQTFGPAPRIKTSHFGVDAGAGEDQSLFTKEPSRLHRFLEGAGGWHLELHPLRDW